MLVVMKHNATPAEIDAVVDGALEQAGLSLADVDVFGVTAGPGLIGALRSGAAPASPRSSTVAARTHAASFKRLSRWSQKKPVLWPSWRSTR